MQNIVAFRFFPHLRRSRRLWRRRAMNIGPAWVSKSLLSTFKQYVSNNKNSDLNTKTTETKSFPVVKKQYINTITLLAKPELQTKGVFKSPFICLFVFLFFGSFLLSKGVLFTKKDTSAAIWNEKCSGYFRRPVLETKQNLEGALLPAEVIS